MNTVSLRCVPGREVPTPFGHDHAAEHLTLETVIITEQATVAGLPLVDFRCRDSNGRLVILQLTGQIVNTIGAAVRGVNLRNHGVEEP